MAGRRDPGRAVAMGVAAWLLAVAPLLSGTSLLLAQVPELSAGPRDTEVELGGSYDDLGPDFGVWRSVDFEAVHRFARHTKLTGGLRRTTRFGLSDTEVALGGYLPITPSLVANAEARASTPGDVLPKQTYALQAQLALGAGWVVHGGYRRKTFDNSGVDAYSLTGELYVSRFRVSYTATQAQLDSGDTALSHIVTGSAYYDTGSSLNAIVAVGEEMEQVVIGSGDARTERLARFDTVAVSLWGRHWFSERWAATYGVRYREQGDLYESVGAFGGVRRGY